MKIKYACLFELGDNLGSREKKRESVKTKYRTLVVTEYTITGYASHIPVVWPLRVVVPAAILSSMP